MKMRITVIENKKRARGKLFRDRSGEAGYFSAVIGGLMLMLFIGLAVNVFSLLTLRQNLGIICREMITEAAAEGGEPDEAAARVAELAESAGIDPDSVSFSFEGSDFLPGGRHIQLGDVIRLSVTCHTSLSGTGIFEIPLSLTVSDSGISEKWWK